MKKRFLTMLTFLACGAAYALPVGNPSDATLLCDGLLWEGHCGNPCDPCLTWSDAFSIRTGFYGDYVFNRHLRVNTHESKRVIEHTRLFTNAGFIAANFWDRLDLFTTLGASNLKIDTNAFTFSNSLSLLGERVEVESDTRFSWSLGARGTIWECGCTTLGAEFQYFATKPKIDRITLGSFSSIYPANIDAKYWEWQAGLGLSHRINIFVPYVAVKYDRARVNFDTAVLGVGEGGTVTLFNLKSDKHWGYAVGVSLVDCEKASVTVEGRFADEKALYANGQIRF